MTLTLFACCRSGWCEYKVRDTLMTLTSRTRIGIWEHTRRSPLPGNEHAGTHLEMCSTLRPPRSRRRTLMVQNTSTTSRGYANSRIGHLADWSTGQLADWRSRGLDNWRSRGLADAAKRTKTKHAKSPVASARCPARELAICELAYPGVVQ